MTSISLSRYGEDPYYRKKQRLHEPPVPEQGTAPKAVILDSDIIKTDSLKIDEKSVLSHHLLKNIKNFDIKKGECLFMIRERQSSGKVPKFLASCIGLPYKQNDNRDTFEENMIVAGPVDRDYSGSEISEGYTSEMLVDAHGTGIAPVRVTGRKPFKFSDLVVVRFPPIKESKVDESQYADVIIKEGRLPALVEPLEDETLIRASEIKSVVDSYADAGVLLAGSYQKLTTYEQLLVLTAIKGKTTLTTLDDDIKLLYQMINSTKAPKYHSKDHLVIGVALNESDPGGYISVQFNKNMF